ncbi:pyruvate dehydrogenase complex dihydrolipoamide acetyltransferase [soil metagenome]
MADLVMPRLSDSMEEGTIVKWLKEVGDEVALGEELVEIETDKATMTYESDTAGTLAEIVADEGDTLPIGEVIARVGGEASGDSDGGAGAATGAVSERERPGSNGGGPSDDATGPESDTAQERSEPAPVTTPTPSSGPTPLPSSSSSEPGARVKASPIAKRVAKDKGIDLGGLSGSGPGGRIVKADVERVSAGDGAAIGGGPGVAEPASPTPEPETQTGASPGPPPTPAPSSVETAKGSTKTVELTKLQQTVARRMAESKAVAPHFYLQAEVDMTAAVEGRKRLKESAAEGEPVPTYNDMVVKACAIALREMPRANGAYKDGKIELYSRVNVGVAVAAQDALVVPTVFDADQKGLRRISGDTRALAAKVRDGSITPPELSGGTFTVSNLGMYGVSNFQAVINTPQAAILAVGEVKSKPAVFEGEITPRELMGVTLACDHRILYGADGALFLKRVRELLEEPLGLAL